jgi:hypothetical protein
MGCREDLKQRTSELPPEVFAVCPERIFAYGFVNFVFVTMCIVTALFFPCKVVLLCRSTLYVENVIRERNEGVCAHLLRASVLRSRLVRSRLLPNTLRRSGTALPLWMQLASNPLSSKCFRKTHSLGLKNIVMSRTRVFFDHIVVSCCAERPLTLDKSRPRRRPGRALAQANSGARTA